MNKIVNKILIDTKFDIDFKNIKNMKFNSYIFKICRHVNFYFFFFFGELFTQSFSNINVTNCI